MENKMKDGAVPMSGEEVMQHVFTHDMCDEIHIANKYLDYAIALDNEGRECVAKKFAEMGYEEYTHAYVMRDMLIERGFTLSQETAMTFDQLKHRIHTLFRG